MLSQVSSSLSFCLTLDLPSILSPSVSLLFSSLFSRLLSLSYSALSLSLLKFSPLLLCHSCSSSSSLSCSFFYYALISRSLSLLSLTRFVQMAPAAAIYWCFVLLILVAAPPQRSGGVAVNGRYRRMMEGNGQRLTVGGYHSGEVGGAFAVEERRVYSGSNPLHNR